MRIQKRTPLTSLRGIIWMVLPMYTLAQTPIWEDVIWRTSQNEIVTAKFDGSNYRVIHVDPSVDFVSQPELAPGGQTLAFKQGTPTGFQLCLIDESGVQCFDAPGLTYGFGWSPDGQIIYYCANQGDGEIWKIDLSQEMPQAELFLDPPVYRTFGLDVSSNGQKMIMVHDPNNWTYNNYLEIYDFSTHQSQVIYPTNGHRDFFPDYSPSRPEIVWSEGDSSDTMDVLLIQDDGSHPINLTPDTPGVHQQFPRFSPDGNQVFYVEAGNLWVVNRDGSSARQLLSLGEDAIFDITKNYVEEVMLFAEKDTYLRRPAPNTNEGQSPFLRVRGVGRNRALVSFDLEGLSLANLRKATLILTIDGIGHHWGSGQPVAASPILDLWEEGNGFVAEAPASLRTRGDGSGSTWNCATDAEIGNLRPDCNPFWQGGSFGTGNAMPVIHTNCLGGEIAWDVTRDLLEGFDSGWIIHKLDEWKPGFVKYHSYEGAMILGNIDLAPKLLLEFNP